MSETIDFDEVYYYNTLKSGITVTVKINFGDEHREVNAKIDTGAENCIFERKHGERLGIDIESGQEQIFQRQQDAF